jgi:transposase InsO family protein
MYTEQTIIPAWNMVVKNRPIYSSLIFHSDRGIQYASKRFRNVLKAYPLTKQLMSRKEELLG